MRLSTRDQNKTIRMEDVVFTLNNIMDDITGMYAGSFGGELSDDSPTEVDVSSKYDDQAEPNPLTRPDSPTLSEPPLSARSEGNSDSEDSLSLYSASPEPSPTSSGFTTPSSSPKSLIFITDKDTTSSNTALITCVAGVDKVLTFMHANAQSGTHTSLEHSLGMDTENIEALESPSFVAPISILGIPNIKPELSSNHEFLWAPNLPLDSGPFTNSSPSMLSEQGGVEIIYQTSTSSSLFSAAASEHMPSIRPSHLTMAPPRLPPRPAHARDSPPHILALQSPTLRYTPRLDQNETWDTGSRMKQNQLGAAHLVKQRQWARATVTYASSLAEPQDLPPCRPVDKYLEWGSGSSPTVNPPRKRILGAMARRVYVGPRTLSRGDWDPERRGGAIDRWNNREALRRERIRSYADIQQDHRPKLKPIVPLRINTSRNYGNDSNAQRKIDQEAAGEGNASVSAPCGTDFAQEGEEVDEVRGTSRGDRDMMRLCVQDGKRVQSGLPSSDSGPQPEPPTPEKALTISACGPPASENLNRMRWCVKNGVRISSQTRNPAADSNSRLKIGTGGNGQESPDEGKHTVSGSTHDSLTLDRKRIDTEHPYVPKKKSPLGIMLLPISSVTMKFQLLEPGDTLGLGKTRRKFASMIF